MSREYDLVIIGNGTAAFAAAIKASELSEGNAKILMIGKGPIGGTCVNVGCIPSKYLLELSHEYFYSKMKKFEGLDSSRFKLNFKKAMQGLRDLVSNLRREKYENVIKAYSNVEYIEGKATFSSPNEVVVEDRKFKAKYIITAVGSRPSLPNIEGLKEAGYLDSNSVWSIEELPNSIAIIGGGAIGLELGQAFLHLGSEVKVIEALDRIAPIAEPELSLALQQILAKEGMSFYLKARINYVKKQGEKKVLEVINSKGKEILEVDEILVATGRVPNTNDLRLDRAKVETDSRGFIITNETMQTSNPKIYAAGDCVSKKLMLATLAAREGVVAASNIFGLKSKMEYESAPQVIFTKPQLASVGYLEQEFMKKYGSCSCNTIGLENVPKAILLNETEGLIKIVINPANGKLVGLHVLAHLASEYIIEGALAIKLGLTINDIIETVHAFPTLSESIKIAAQSFLRDVRMMSCCVE